MAYLVMGEKNVAVNWACDNGVLTCNLLDINIPCKIIDDDGQIHNKTIVGGSLSIHDNRGTLGILMPGWIEFPALTIVVGNYNDVSEELDGVLDNDIFSNEYIPFYQTEVNYTINNLVNSINSSLAFVNFNLE